VGKASALLTQSRERGRHQIAKKKSRKF